MNEITKDIIDSALNDNVVDMQTNIETTIKNKLIDALENKKQELAMNFFASEEKCSDKDKNEDEDDEIEPKELKKLLLQKKLQKESNLSEESRYYHNVPDEDREKAIKKGMKIDPIDNNLYFTGVGASLRAPKEWKPNLVHPRSNYPIDIPTIDRTKAVRVKNTNESVQDDDNDPAGYSDRKLNIEDLPQYKQVAKYNILGSRLSVGVHKLKDGSSGNQPSHAITDHLGRVIQTFNNRTDAHTTAKAYANKIKLSESQKVAENIENIDEITIANLEKYRNAARTEIGSNFKSGDPKIAKRVQGLNTAYKKIKTQRPGEEITTLAKSFNIPHETASKVRSAFYDMTGGKVDHPKFGKLHPDNPKVKDILKRIDPSSVQEKPSLFKNVLGKLQAQFATSEEVMECNKNTKDSD